MDIRILPVRPAAGLGVLSLIAAVLAFLIARDCDRNQVIHHLPTSFIPSLFYGTVYWMWWVVVTLVLWILADRRADAFKPSRLTLMAHFGASCLLAAAHLALLQQTIRLGAWYWPVWGQLVSKLWMWTLERFGVELVIYGFISGVCAFLYSRMQTQRALVQKLELERQLTQAQLQQLQMQIEPHFLFNTLNAITSLVVQRRNDEAVRTMTHLSEILRSTLQRAAPEKVSIAEELRIVESYLAIQQTRFAGRLIVKIEATDEARNGLVPCFLLQPLVENAIQHGIAPRLQGGSIQTCAKRIGDTLWMQVKDDGRGAGDLSTKGHGIGLQNIKDRLAHFYPGSHEFCAVSPAGGGYEVTIEIPYERATV